jgi:hypothetical protein
MYYSIDHTAQQCTAQCNGDVTSLRRSHWHKPSQLFRCNIWAMDLGSLILDSESAILPLLKLVGRFSDHTKIHSIMELK